MSNSGNQCWGHRGYLYQHDLTRVRALSSLVLSNQVTSETVQPADGFRLRMRQPTENCRFVL